MSNKAVGIMGDSMEIFREEGLPILRCQRCGFKYGPAREGPKMHAVYQEYPIRAISPINAYGSEEMVLRQFYCPQCGVSIAANVQRKQDPLFEECSLEGGGLSGS